MTRFFTAIDTADLRGLVGDEETRHLLDLDGRTPCSQDELVVYALPWRSAPRRSARRHGASQRFGGEQLAGLFGVLSVEGGVEGEGGDRGERDSSLV